MISSPESRRAAGSTRPDTEAPGLSVFALSEGVVYHTYSYYARGLDILLGNYQLLDRAPKGRDEEASGPDWVRRHDEYDDVRR